MDPFSHISSRFPAGNHGAMDYAKLAREQQAALAGHSPETNALHLAAAKYLHRGDDPEAASRAGARYVFEHGNPNPQEFK